ncbi:MAG: class I SAM-dependent methyltransferase [Candidatus Latescibacterota bacterium]
MADSRASIHPLAKALAAEFKAADVRLLERYLGDVVVWNERVALLSRRSLLPSLERLVRQSGTFLQFLIDRGAILPGQGQSVIDIGSGAGFPGLAWKLMEPSLKVTLLERRQKKATFLQRMTVVLGLTNVRVVEGDAAELSTFEKLIGRYDLATSFAVAPPTAMARLAEPFIRPGGYYATLRPRAEHDPPKRIGHSLVLADVADNDLGRFCLYQSTA